MELSKIYNENCLDTMARMPDGFVDLVVTSPPYDGLRKYNGYSFDFEAVAKELFRVVKVGGVVVWVVGDSVEDFSESMTSFRQALYFRETGFNVKTMIYQRPVATWNESSLCYKPDFEFCFILSKGKPKAFNPIKDITVRNLTPRKVLCKKNTDKPVYETVYPNEKTARGQIWKYNSGSFSNESRGHPAVFPEKLAADHIYSWSNEGDLVYDPFGGSGTTAKMAHLQNRKWILSEISGEYCELSRKRIEPYLLQQSLFTSYNGV